MNVSIIPILIANPAKQAEENLLKFKPSLMVWDGSYSSLYDHNGKSKFRDMKPNDNLSKILLTILKWPNMNRGSIYANTRIHSVVEILDLASSAGLVTNIPPKSYKGNNPGYRITKLGMALLKQNGLID